MKPARKAIPGFKDNLITHAGPPISWERMIKVQKMAVINAIRSEGLADTPATGRQAGQDTGGMRGA